MGKKKSVVFMTLITIVILVLCAIVAFPAITIPGSDGIKKWNPAAMQYDLSEEFGGGHYAYYYPNGVITETEYQNNLEGYEDGSEEKQEYADSYVRHGNTSLYLNKEEGDIFTEDGKISEGFKTAFNKAVDLLSERFAERAAKTGSTYRVAVVDDYAIRVDLSATESTKNQTSSSYASNAFGQLCNMGKVTLELEKEEGSELVAELQDEGTDINDLIKSITVKTRYKVAYLKITFTSKGKTMLKAFKDAEDATALNLKIGDDTVLAIDKENHINTKNEVEYGVAQDTEKLNADTLCVLLNSAMKNGGVYINDIDTTPFVLEAPAGVEIRSYEPVHGDILLLIYGAVLAVMLFACVFAIVKMGGFGVMNLYTSLTYFAVVAFCFAFISGGVFAVNLSSVLLFLVGLIVTNVMNAYICKAIKAEAQLGKTIQSAVKSGYKKTIWTVVDVYAVALLGAVALLIGAAALNTFACQAIICILTAAFCNLLWGRVINVMLLSASKDKYKYFRLVREDDDDE